MTTLDKTKEIISRITHCNQDDINPDTTLKEIKADSLHWIQIIVGLENAFDIEIDIDKMKEFSSIGDFISYIDSCA